MVTYFTEDLKKEGGSYKIQKGFVSKIDQYNKAIIINDVMIKICDILDIDFV